MYVNNILLSDFQFFHCFFKNNVCQMRIERVSSNKTGQFSVVLEVICFYFCCIYYFWYENSISLWDLIEIIFVSFQKVYEVAPSLFMVDVRKAAGETLEYHKVSLYLHISAFWWLKFKMLLGMPWVSLMQYFLLMDITILIYSIYFTWGKNSFKTVNLLCTPISGSRLLTWASHQWSEISFARAMWCV